MDALEKLKSFEIKPPEGLWDHIAEKLDESEASQRLAQKIQEISVTPPAGIWDRITGELDADAPYDKLGRRLRAMEMTAPPAAWDRIAAELDDSQALEIIEKKLSSLEIQPPATAWPQIRAELTDTKPAKLVPISSSHGWLKYAAAACVIAILSITGYFIFSDNSSPAAYTAKQSTGSSNGYASTDTRQGQVADRGNRQTVTPQQQMMATVRTKLGNTYTTTLERNRELKNRYIVLMTQDGNIVRMSSKLGNMADCIAGADHSCDEQISEWQQEMAAMPATATPDNLLSILDMASGE